MAKPKPLPTRRSPDGVLTPPGMAHWAGTGPAGTTCRECRWWMTTGKWSEDQGPGGGGAPLPARCRRYKAFGMLKRFGPALNHDTPSCKYFLPAAQPQPPARPVKLDADWLA